jgi:beta-glucanase (GH16 family)
MIKATMAGLSLLPFITIAVLLLLILAAAQSTRISIVIEAEAGQLQSSVTHLSDNNASGGQAISFGAATIPQPLGPTGSWSLRFNDEFNGSTLDLSKWRPNWLAGTDTALTPPINSLESGCYDPAQVSVGGGNLTLAAVAVTPGSRPGCVVRGGANASYASGIITSRHDYTFTYGYIESRIWLPPGNGLGQNWAAFWADGTGTWPTTGEIDVMEVLSNHIPCWHFHYQDSSGNHQGPGGCPTLAQLGGNYSGWHVFGAEWEPGSIKYFYDGQQVGQITSGVTNAPMFLIANYAVSATGTPPIVVPQNMQVDYIRHWQR